MMKAGSWLKRLFLCGLMSVIPLWAVFYGMAAWSDRAQRGFWNQIGMLSLFLIIGAVSVWFLKQRIIKAKQSDRAAFPWVSGAVIKGLREAHIALGWLAFDLGLGHGVYYMVNMPTRMNHFISGVIVLAAMLALIITGLMYKHKILSPKTIKKFHFAVSGIFGLLLAVHI